MFTNERSLVNSLKANYKAICHWNTIAHSTEVMEEVNLGFGIADLVILKLGDVLQKKSESLTYFDVVIYNIVYTKKSISLEQIKEITRANTSLINRSVAKLTRESYVNKKDHVVFLSNRYQGVASDIVAIEAKLKNWKRALNQAFRYKWFASKSFVVLDSAHIKPALVNIYEFEKLNVGLAEIDILGNIQLHFKPKKANPIDHKMWILMNETARKSFLRKEK
jgi:hypothetical protein